MIALLSAFLLASEAVAQTAAPSPYTPEVPTASALSELDELAEPVVANIGSQVYFDSNKTGFSNDLKKQLLEGDVVVIGGGTLVAADKVQLDRSTNVVEARGHLVILNQSQLFIGDSVVYHLATGDFEIRDAVMLTNDAAEIEKVTRRIFGFTPKEVEFEKQRQRRLAEISELKARLRREARRQLNAGASLAPDLVNRYTLLLEQEALVSGQENPSLARFPSERRESLKKRRDFWQKSQSSGIKAGGTLAAAYFRLEGEQLTRSNGNDYVARNALFTPCRCEGDETPAWAFRADEIEAQLGGYADLSHPVLEIKGMPILYLPHLKLPLKDRRQSGFLPPTFGFEPRSGNIYTQPVYFDLGPSSDATFTTDVFEKRGTRLGVEYRTQQKEHSGWEVSVEGMRDRVWMEDRGVREELGNMYREGLGYAANGTNPPVAVPGDDAPGKAYTEQYLKNRDYWNQVLAGDRYGGGSIDDPASVARLEQDINQHLAVPENTWRGSYSWRGVSYLAPRLSLVSNGEVASDHRYSEELYVPDDFKEAFFGGTRVKSFSTGNAQLHLDGKDFYAGLGTRFGDNYLLDERFQGQQEPVRFKLQSRYYPLVPPGSPLPIYGQLTTENIRITEFKASSEDEDDAITANPSLGDGNWKRAKIDTVTPVVSDRIISVNQFNSFEARYIDHASLSDHRSEIRSWLAGVEFRLPIDGKGPAPSWFGQADCEGPNPAPECVEPDDPAAPKKFVHHIMDWRLRFATRPSVVRRGPYGDPFADPGEPVNGQLSYFASDTAAAADQDVAALDNDVPDEERMQLSRRVTLFTDNVWKLLNRGWARLPGEAPAPRGKAAANDPGERARRELLYEVDRPVDDAADLYDEANKRWLVDRYRLDDQYYATPLTFRADASYDFIDAEKRDRLRKENAEAPAGTPEQPLPTAWKPVNAELGIYHLGFSLLSTVSYDVYLKQSVRLGQSLTTPSIFQTNLQLGYTVSGKYNATEDRVDKEYERKFLLASSLAAPVTTYLSIKRRDIKGEEPTYTKRFEIAEGIDYNSPSQCWGLQFLRQKDYAKEEREAKYLLQLSVIFMGERRPLGNMAPGVVRDTTGRQPEES